MTPEEAETRLFGATLTCEEPLQACFLVRGVDRARAELACAQAEKMLHAIAVIEDSRSHEDEDHAQSHSLRRIEARLELLATLVGAMARDSYCDPVVLLRWSALGASLQVAEPVPVHATGALRVQVAPWHPEPIELPATVLALDVDGQSGSRVWLGFGELTEGASGALERHLFRQHRRAIAEKRRHA